MHPYQARRYYLTDPWNIDEDAESALEDRIGSANGVQLYINSLEVLVDLPAFLVSQAPK